MYSRTFCNPPTLRRRHHASRVPIQVASLLARSSRSTTAWSSRFRRLVFMYFNSVYVADYLQMIPSMTLLSFSLNDTQLPKYGVETSFMLQVAPLCGVLWLWSFPFAYILTKGTCSPCTLFSPILLCFHMFVITREVRR
jgi:hypothetical protein